MEILVCPVARIPLSALLVGSDGKDEPIRSVPAQLQELPEGFTLFHQPPRGSTPDFLSGFTPIAFTSPKATTRQWLFCGR